mgnify:CR=1 FL=1
MRLSVLVPILLNGELNKVLSSVLENLGGVVNVLFENKGGGGGGTGGIGGGAVLEGLKIVEEGDLSKRDDNGCLKLHLFLLLLFLDLSLLK